jgi:hypothetical protein
MTVLVPLPVILPGLIVHVPVDGKPLSAILPVAMLQVGCVMVDTEGVVGGLGTGSMTILAVVVADVQPAAFVTEKLYVPAAKPETVVLTVEPVEVIPFGNRVSDHDPDGKPLSVILPVGIKQVGWTTVPTKGVLGLMGAALIVTTLVGGDVQPAAFVTENV